MILILFNISYVGVSRAKIDASLLKTEICIIMSIWEMAHPSCMRSDTVLLKRSETKKLTQFQLVLGKTTLISMVRQTYALSDNVKKYIMS